MAIQQPTNRKPAVATFATDSDIGASLVQLTGYPTGVLGYQGASDGYQQYEQGDVLLAMNLGGAATNVYLVANNSTGTGIVAIRISSLPSGGSTGADIVLVVAKSATYSPLVLSSAVYSTIAAAIAAAPTTGASIILLDDSYAESLATTKPIGLIGLSSATRVTINPVNLVPLANNCTTGVVTLRNVTLAGGTAAALTHTTGAITEAFNSAFSGAAATITQSGAATFRGTQCAVTGGIVVATQSLIDVTTTAASTAATSSTVRGGTLAAYTSAASNFRNVNFTSTLSITGTASALALEECTIAGAFTSAITAARTVRQCSFAAGCTFAGAITMERCTNASTCTAPSLTAQNCNMTGLLTTSGTVAINQGTYLGGITYTGTTGAVTIEEARIVGTCTFTRSVTARESSFTRTTAGAAVTLTSAAAQTSRFEACTFTSTSGNAIQVAANDTCVLSAGTWNISTFIATAGAGTTQVIGQLPGGVRVTTTNVIASISATMVWSQYAGNASGANTMATLGGGANNPLRDLFSLTPLDAYPTLTSLTFYPGSEIADGWRVTVRNNSLQNSLQLVASGGDTLSADTLLPPGASRTFQYTRSGATATIVAVS